MRGYELTCREVVGRLGQALAGDLPEAVRPAWDRHLGTCPDCRSYASSYEATIELGRAAFLGDDTSVPDELVDAILETRRTVG